MKTYGDLRRALREQPTSWTLGEDVLDDSPLPEYPLMREEVPSERKRPTSQAELRAILRAHPPTDPRVLVRAVEIGLISRRSAQRRIRLMWGPDFSIDDFSAEKGTAR